MQLVGFTIEKNSYIFRFFYLALLLEVRVLLYRQTKSTRNTNVNIKWKRTQERRIIRQDAISRSLRGDYCAGRCTRCVTGENKTAAAARYSYFNTVERTFF